VIWVYAHNYTSSRRARAGHTQAGRKIEYLSIAWTTLEAVVGIIAGVLAGSVALIGFGVDSAIEVASSIVLLWRVTDHPQVEEREKVAYRLVGVGFLALAAYISFDALHDLITHELPGVSSFLVLFRPLPALSSCHCWHAPSAALPRSSAAMRFTLIRTRATSALTFQLSCLSASGSTRSLAGGGLNPVAALCMLPIMIKEGVAGLRGESCSYHH
jgi:hypothetical protein